MESSCYSHSFFTPPAHPKVAAASGGMSSQKTLLNPGTRLSFLALVGTSQRVAKRLGGENIPTDCQKANSYAWRVGERRSGLECLTKN